MTRSGFVLLSCLAICCCTVSSPEAARRVSPIRRLTLDPDAQVVEIFDGMESGDLEARVVAKSAEEGLLFVSNKTDKPLTVAIPPAVAAVHVLNQGGPQTAFPFNFDNNQQQGQNQQGGAQSVGGQPGGIGNQLFQTFPGQNSAQNPFPGSNFFSVPPERSVQLKLDTVCLDHGRPDPQPKMTYRLIPIEKRVSDRHLRELLASFDRNSDDRASVQAAAWHLSNGLTWKELRSKQQRVIGIGFRHYFTRQQIDKARQLVADAARTLPAAPEPVVSATGPTGSAGGR